MIDNRRVLDVIYAAIELRNETASEEHRLKKSPETILFGKSAKLDSLGLVTLIVAIEERLADELGAIVSIADERALTQPRSPFRTIGSLAAYVSDLLEERIDG